MKNSSGYHLLIDKLNRFIRKYYTNQLLKGSLLFLGVNLFLFVIFNVMEAQFYFSASTRKILFYSGLLIIISTLVYWVGLPLVRMFRLGKTISHDDAAQIIGNHFPAVKDKLLNILQLARQSGQSDNDLLLHSIEQKTNDIKLVSFPRAIDLRKNRKYFKYALPPLLLLIVLLFSAPSMITESSYRLYHNNEEFERQAPFSFLLGNGDLSLPQFEDIEILMNTEGDVNPQEAYISVDNFQYKMKKNDQGQFSYTLKNVGNDTEFHFAANGFSSKPYDIIILKKPSLARMNIHLDFPSYTGMKDKDLLNEGDIILPTGTKVSWTFDTENMSDLGMIINPNTIDTLLNTRNNIATYNQRIYKNTDYKLIFNSTDIPEADSVLYSIEAIPDEYPKISLHNEVDSLNTKLNYIIGEASDDYGVRKITYNYAIIPEGTDPGQEIDFETQMLKNTSGKATTYEKIIDVSDFDLAPGSALWYYFEVFDNDGVHGSKSSKTAIQHWTQKTMEEFEEMEENAEENIKSNLEDILKKQQELIKTTEELRNNLLQEKELNWQRKKEMEKLIQNQQSIQDKLQQTQQMHEQNKQNQEEFKKNNNEENNEEIQKMMEQARNPKLEELMQKIQDLMEKMKKDEAVQELEEMSREMNQSEMDMKRLEQLYKKLEMESDLMDQAEKLEKLAEEQDQLAEENLEEESKDEVMDENEDEASGVEENKNEEKSGEQKTDEESKKENKMKTEEESNDNDESKNAKSKKNTESSEKKKDGETQEKSNEQKIEEQKKTNEEFEKISKDLEKLFEKNKSLERPAEMENPKTPSEEIKKDQNESMDQMQSGSPQKAGQKQKEAGKKMKEMAQSLQQKMQSGQQKQQQEDIKTLRQILENLIKLSFDQETLIDDVAPMSYATPQYVEKVREQFDLKNDFTLIQDSLLALANRNPQIEGTVTEKVNLIDSHIGKSLKLMEDQEKSDAANDQRRTMKNVNDLALMLTESLQNMQMEMSTSNSMCQNPGSKAGSVPMDKITEGQKKLTQEMKDMAQKRQEGKGKGKGKGGESSKDFAQTAAEQAAMRKMLEEKQQKLMEQGKGSKQLQQLIDMMDKMETDLVNKRLTNEMMERQQEILTRLLEAEKAERQQEMDEQRKSEEAKNVPKTLPPDLQKYLDQRREEITPYQKLSPALKPYYKQLVEEYYIELKNR